jgi:hypothetical protein
MWDNENIFENLGGLQALRPEKLESKRMKANNWIMLLNRGFLFRMMPLHLRQSLISSK